MNKCTAYKANKGGILGEHGRCLATREVDVCQCGGDAKKCDFYPSVVERAIELEKQEAAIKELAREIEDMINCGIDDGYAIARYIIHDLGYRKDGDDHVKG